MRSALVVENFKLISDIWLSILKQLNFEDLKALADSDQVYSYIEENRPEFVLMDINLPGALNGLELTEKITRDFPNIKVCIISVYNGSTYLKAAKRAGAMGYISKSKSLEEIKRAILQIMHGGEAFIE